MGIKEVSPGIFVVDSLNAVHLDPSEISIGESISEVNETHLDTTLASKFNDRIQNYNTAAEMISNAPHESISFVNDKLYYRDNARFHLLTENEDTSQVALADAVEEKEGSTQSHAAASLPTNMTLSRAGQPTVITFDPATLPANASLGMFDIDAPPQAAVTFENNTLTITPSTDFQNNGNFGVRIFSRSGYSEVSHRFNFTLDIPYGAAPLSFTNGSTTNTDPSSTIPIVLERNLQNVARISVAYDGETAVQPVTATFTFPDGQPSGLVSVTEVDSEGATVAADLILAEDFSTSIVVSLTDASGITRSWTQPISHVVQDNSLYSISQKDPADWAAHHSIGTYTWGPPVSYVVHNPSSSEYRSNLNQVTSEIAFMVQPSIDSNNLYAQYIDFLFYDNSIADLTSYSVNTDNMAIDGMVFDSTLTPIGNNTLRYNFTPPSNSTSDAYANDNVAYFTVQFVKSNTTISRTIYLVFDHSANHNYALNSTYTVPIFVQLEASQTSTSVTPRTTGSGSTNFSSSLGLGATQTYTGPTITDEVRIFADNSDSFNDLVFTFQDRPEVEGPLTFTHTTNPISPGQLYQSIVGTIDESGTGTKYVLRMKVGDPGGSDNEFDHHAASGSFQLTVTATDSSSHSFSVTVTCRLYIEPLIDPSQATVLSGNGLTTGVTAFDGTVNGMSYNNKQPGGNGTILRTKNWSPNLTLTTVATVNDYVVDTSYGPRGWNLNTTPFGTSNHISQPFIGYTYTSPKAVTRVVWSPNNFGNYYLNASNSRFDYRDSDGTWHNLAVTVVRNSNTITNASKTQYFLPGYDWFYKGWYHDDCVAYGEYNEITVNEPVWATSYRIRDVRNQGTTHSYRGSTALGAVVMYGVSQ